ncbi:hypothetical protein [Mycolicibacterium elephantis]|uniref:hypothetical protein n=1 Tax=Mycolicibacterium elephantis TaxID=81858 RepID=UPI0010425C5A|nr:hypothetical protein [Mycolicibacterium elephantis]
MNALLPFEPVAVIPGCEPGVELADALSEALHPLTGTPSNGTALSSARRNKFEMIERIKSQGLQGARQIRVESEEQLCEWHTQLGGMAILKPLRSSSNDGDGFERQQRVHRVGDVAPVDDVDDEREPVGSAAVHRGHLDSALHANGDVSRGLKGRREARRRPVGVDQNDVSRPVVVHRDCCVRCDHWAVHPPSTANA